MATANHIARVLVDLGAVVVAPDKPFRWASGLLSPIYCDNRLLIGNVTARSLVCDAFVALIKNQGWQPDVIAGTATAGIPHAAWVAHACALPMAYVRSSHKAHGRGNQIEGAAVGGKNVVLIEDLISTGGSSIEAANALAESGARVLAILAIFEYGMAKAETNFQRADLIRRSLCGLTELTAMLQQDRLLSSDQARELALWQSDPASWSAAHEREPN